MATDGTGSGDSEMTFDTDSGITEEEQREILEQINGIAERNRTSLSLGAETKRAGAFRAKKHGGLFPILVNVFAILVLAGGFLAIGFFQAEADVSAREGTRALTGAERALIDEIRMETGAALSAKDEEIRLLLASLAAIERQLWELVAGGDELSAEQLAMQARLRIELEERQEALALAREERALILNEARSREVMVLAQPARGPGDVEPETGPQAARDELARLSVEQARALRMEDQIAGLFATVHRQVDDNNLDAATSAIEGLRIILDDSDLRRGEFYAMTVDTIEALFYKVNWHTTRTVSALEGNMTALQTENMILLSENATLVSQAGSLLETLAAQTREATIRQSQITTLNQAVGTRDNTIRELRDRNTSRDNTIRELQERNASQEQTIATLNNQLGTVLELLRSHRQ